MNCDFMRKVVLRGWWFYEDGGFTKMVLRGWFYENVVGGGCNRWSYKWQEQAAVTRIGRE